MFPINDFSELYTHVLAYIYDEIEAYDRYVREYHLHKKDVEIIDHGILGGVKTFDRLVKKIGKDSKTDHPEGKKDILAKQLVFAKISCLTIAQHNIFKSPDTKYDLKYGDELRRLHSTSDFKINMETPLLMLLFLFSFVEKHIS